MTSERISDQSTLKTAIRVFSHPVLRRSSFKLIRSAWGNFFFLQYRAVFFSKRIPVSQVDHPLDERVPFEPKRVSVYLDFVALWIRALGFILRRYGDRAIEPASALIGSIGELYGYAAQVYRQNLSTTRRPRYFKNFRFIMIHLTDPHLLCVPSLHVMIVIRAYTQFRQILREFDDEDLFKAQIEELYKGALEITEAVLYVKQHSVNCVPAALYSMTRFQEELFTVQEARSFTQNLFRSPHDLASGDDGLIRDYIAQLYAQFTEEGKKSEDWRSPILKFLDPLRRRE